MSWHNIPPAGWFWIPAGGRDVRVDQVPRQGPTLSVRWAWWRPRWTRPGRWKDVGR